MRFGFTFDVVLEIEEEIFIVNSFLVLVLDQNVVSGGVECVVVDSTRLLELERLVRRSMVNILDDIFFASLDLSVDKLLLVNVENVLLVSR